jgi:hypothetical protein
VEVGRGVLQQGFDAFVEGGGLGHAAEETHQRRSHFQRLVNRSCPSPPELLNTCTHIQDDTKNDNTKSRKKTTANAN